MLFKKPKRLKFLLSLIIILVITVCIPLAVNLVNKKTSFINKAYYKYFGNNANLTIDLSTSYNFNPPWKFLAQGGEGQEDMLEDVVVNVKKLKPVFIRIDHIYDFYEPVRRDINGNIYFDWSTFDSRIKTIEAIGARPFLSLSYMPKEISTGDEVDLPKNWDDWSFVVQKTIEHVSGKEGLAISGVYYEIWNEPDLFGEFNLKNNKSYLKLYYYASKGASKAVDIFPFMLGGPATTNLYEAWFKKFLDYSQENNLRVDFYSWHKYTKYVKDFEEDLDKVNSWIQAYPKYANMQLIISESGFNSENDNLYDSKFSAIHTLSMFASTFPKTPIIFVFEIKDGPGPEKYWGRWGILTNEMYGVPEEKPRFKALMFLENLKGEYLKVTGQGSWVNAIAFRDPETKNIKIMVVNYDPNQSHWENVSINLVNVPFDKFKLVRNNFLGTTSQRSVSGSFGNWSTRESFEPNTASIFEIIPQ